jgi:hypothetical protein
MRNSTDSVEQADRCCPTIDRRVANRLPIVVNAQCLGSRNHSLDVWLIDISQQGCQLLGGAGLLQSGQQVVILCDGGEAHRGRVMWAAGTKAGMQFDLALPHEKLEQLSTVRPIPSLEPARDFDKLVDQFGRELPPLPSLVKARKNM